MFDHSQVSSKRTKFRAIAQDRALHCKRPMRLLSAVLFVALTGSIGFAEDVAPPTDEAKPAEAKPEPRRSKVPLRVVKLLPETRQVLLLDRNKGTHVLAEVGQDVDGYLVDEIGEDEVTLVAPSGSEVILAAPSPSWRRPAGTKKPAVAKTEPAPVDPYAEPVEEVRAVSAPTAEPEVDPGIAAFVAAVEGNEAAPAPSPTPAAKPTKPANAKAVDTGSSLAAIATGTPAPPVAPGPTTAAIKRTEIDAALADFATTASSFRASFTKDGLRFDDVSQGSLLARVGLAKGDIVTTVDGQPLGSLDDAANLYARLPTARGTTLQVLRAGKPVTLRVTIQ